MSVYVSFGVGKSMDASISAGSKTLVKLGDKGGDDQISLVVVDYDAAIRLAALMTEAAENWRDESEATIVGKPSPPAHEYRPCEKCGGRTWMYTNCRDLECSDCKHQQSAWPPGSDDHVRPMGVGEVSGG